jgi:hypothetical protein
MRPLVLVLSFASCSFIATFDPNQLKRDGGVTDGGGGAEGTGGMGGSDAAIPDASSRDAAVHCSHESQCSDGIGCTVDTCNTTTGVCEHMPNNAACPASSTCFTGACQPGGTNDPSGCVQIPIQCSSSTPVCDSTLGCVECVQASDCRAPDCCTTMQCINNQCFTAASCASGLVCCANAGTCLGCQTRCR